MIKRLYIKNFRSIKELEILPSELCALVGPNSSGKTNILKAIDLVIGEGWTTKATIARELFNNINENIFIAIDLHNPVTWSYYSSLKRITSITLEMSFYPLETKVRLWENFPNDKNGDGYFLNDEFKKACHFIYISSDRNLINELRVSKWTMLGKLMKVIYENYTEHFSSEDKLIEAFQEKMSMAKDFLSADFSPNAITFYKFTETLRKYCKNNSAGLANDFDPVLNIYNINWFYKTLQIQVKEDHLERHFDSDDVGAGMQNLILLSIFQTYSELMGGSVIFGIEEPEIYLYPQAQRSLYKSFIELSSESQIFYTTHNINFVDSSRPEDLNILRKNESGTYCLVKDPFFSNEIAEKNKYKIYTHFNQHRNEIFFAKKVLLVEGDSDRILFHTLCEEKWSIDVDSLGISIIECGGKTGVIYFLGVCKLIGHNDYFAVWDKDNKDKIVDSHNLLLNALNQGIGLEFNPDMETELKIQKGDKVKNAHDFAIKINNEDIPEKLLQVKKFLDNNLRASYTDDIPF